MTDSNRRERAGYPEINLVFTSEPDDWPASADEVTAQLRDFHPADLAGVIFKTNAVEDGRAFQGPYISVGRYADRDHAPLSAVVSSNSSTPIREDVNRIVIPADRLAEIADGYSLPEHLRQPRTPIDAGIAFIIMKMASIDPDHSKSFGDIADESRALEIAQNLDLTDIQARVALMSGEVAFEDGNANYLYRAEQLEALEHVLRFLLHQPHHGRGSSYRAYLGTDYASGTGVMGEALAIVNGANGFSNSGEGAGLAMGSLPSKLSMLITEQEVTISSPVPGQRIPIWPPEKVSEYAQKQAEIAEQARLQLQETEARNRQIASERAVQRETAERERAQKINDLEAHLEPLKELGYVWKGIMPRTGRLETEDGIQDYITTTYPGKEVHIINGFAIYGGENVVIDEGQFTIFVKE